MEELIRKFGITTVYVSCSKIETRDELQRMVNAVDPHITFKSVENLPYTCDFLDRTYPNNMKKAKSKMNRLRVHAEEDDPDNFTSSHLYIVVHTEIRKHKDGWFRTEESVQVEIEKLGLGANRERVRLEPIPYDKEIEGCRKLIEKVIRTLLERM